MEATTEASTSLKIDPPLADSPLETTGPNLPTLPRQDGPSDLDKSTCELDLIAPQRELASPALQTAALSLGTAATNVDLSVHVNDAQASGQPLPDQPAIEPRQKKKKVGPRPAESTRPVTRRLTAAAQAASERSLRPSKRVASQSLGTSGRVTRPRTENK